jgi:hypothetical protein
MKGLRGWFVAALLLCTSGCAMQLAYNNLDRLVRWQVSDYVALDADQRRYFDAAVHDLWTWHRRDHLPRYAQRLEELKLGQLTDEGEMQLLVDQVVEWANEIAGRAMPVAAQLLASLSDEQVARLAGALADSNRKMAEAELDVPIDQAQRNWQKEVADRFGQFSGRLTVVQQEYLRQQSVRYVPEQVLWAEYRRRWQADLLTLLAHRGEAADFARGFEQLVANQALYYGPELTAIMNENRQLTREVSVWLMGSMTDRQQQRFEDRLQGLADDFRALAQASGRAPPSSPLLCLVLCS